MKLGRVLTYKDIEEAKKLVGKKVLYSDYQGAIESDGCSSGDTLLAVREDSIEPFIVETARYHADKKDRAYQFIREILPDEPEYEPYDLSDPKVRDSLRGRWFRDEYGNEVLVNLFDYHERRTVNVWHVNGYSPRTFLEKCEWLDGTPCGRMMNCEPGIPMTGDDREDRNE